MWAAARQPLGDAVGCVFGHCRGLGGRIVPCTYVDRTCCGRPFGDAVSCVFGRFRSRGCRIVWRGLQFHAVFVRLCACVCVCVCMCSCVRVTTVRTFGSRNSDIVGGFSQIVPAARASTGSHLSRPEEVKVNIDMSMLSFMVIVIVMVIVMVIYIYDVIASRIPPGLVLWASD